MTVKKPIFVATHPRACSTAFERVFMTRDHDLSCIHEPFGDAFYFGPERLSERYENDEKARVESGFSKSTYKTILDRIDEANSEGKRLFIKDIIHYLVPPNGQPASIAPSLARLKRGVGTSGHATEDVHEPKDTVPGAPYPYGTNAEAGNPTVIPEDILKKFHFTFLIRHPSRSIPSYYRCTIPPLDKVTGFYEFKPSEAGYDETRRFFDFLRSVGQVGPHIAGRSEVYDGVHRAGDHVEICVVDADDLLDQPANMIEKFCDSVGLDYDPQMLVWDQKEDHKHAAEIFEKWKGFHEDAIHSSSLKPRQHKKKVLSKEEEDAEWKDKFGEKGAEMIRETVDANIKDYEYLKQFAIKV